MAILCMRDASSHNCRNSSFIVDLAMGQMPRSTERISSLVINSATNPAVGYAIEYSFNSSIFGGE